MVTGFHDGVRIARAEQRTEKPREVRRGEHPQEPRRHGRQADRQRKPGKLLLRHRMDARDDRIELEPDENEGHAVHQEFEGIPDRLHLDPALGREHLRRVAGPHQAGCDDREHAGDVHGLSRQIGHVGQQQRQQDLDQRIVEPRVDHDEEPAEQQPEEDTADRDHEELHRRVRE